MNTFSHVPPGFRFHPTDEELVDYYLTKKISSGRIDIDVIKDVDLYRIEPWDLQEICRIGREEQNEWYFFSHKDKKYPTGTRTNRATAAGFWKATGRDKAIYSKHDLILIGMRKTLVFYKGRAPNGQKSDWIMHEYRLETDHENATPQEEGWVVCRVFKKRVTTTTTTTRMRKESEHDSPPCWYYNIDQVSFTHMHADLDDSSPPNQSSHQSNLLYHLPYQLPCKKELDLAPYQMAREQLPLLQQNPKLGGNNNNNIINEQMGGVVVDQVVVTTTTTTDWRVLDKFVASQLSQDNNELSNKEDNNNNSYSSSTANIFQGDTLQNSNVQFRNLDKQEIIMHMLPDHQIDALTSNSTCPIDLWK